MRDRSTRLLLNNPAINQRTQIEIKKVFMNWISVKDKRPTDYGKYLIFRAKCGKIHFETWNNTGWAYNNNDITHWMPIPEPPTAHLTSTEGWNQH
jgi:hypothetical protein